MGLGSALFFSLASARNEKGREWALVVVVVVVGRGDGLWAEKLILFLLFFFQDKLWDRNIVINMLLCLCVFSQL